MWGMTNTKSEYKVELWKMSERIYVIRTDIEAWSKIPNVECFVTKSNTLFSVFPYCNWLRTHTQTHTYSCMRMWAFAATALMNKKGVQWNINMVECLNHRSGISILYTHIIQCIFTTCTIYKYTILYIHIIWICRGMMKHERNLLALHGPCLYMVIFVSIDRERVPGEKESVLTFLLHGMCWYRFFASSILPVRRINVYNK